MCIMLFKFKLRLQFLDVCKREHGFFPKDMSQIIYPMAAQTETVVFCSPTLSTLKAEHKIDYEKSLQDFYFSRNVLSYEMIRP